MNLVVELNLVLVTLSFQPRTLLQGLEPTLVGAN